jgi:hypothetical protein
MSANQDSNTQDILHKRIAFALRRFTGVSYDVGALLARSNVRSRRLALWRQAGCNELNRLLDQLEAGATGEQRASQAARVLSR